jgi:hypothetical protein
MQRRVYERARELMEAELGDELVALDPAGGACFGFNPVAATIWRLLEQPHSLEDLTQLLVLEYDVEPSHCEAEVSELLEVLAARDLVCSRTIETG